MTVVLIISIMLYFEINFVFVMKYFIQCFLNEIYNATGICFFYLNRICMRIYKDMCTKIFLMLIFLNIEFFVHTLFYKKKIFVNLLPETFSKRLSHFYS